MNSPTRPYSPACDRNREPILNVLSSFFAPCSSVLEIGSGTGQHAVHFAASMPHLIWQTSDVVDNLSGIDVWLSEAQLPNAPPPLQLDVDDTWPCLQFDGVFTANTLHIMSWNQVISLFAHLREILKPQTLLAIYGPFNYNGQFTSESNANFDASLKARDVQMGIRDIAAVQALAKQIDVELVEDLTMPANNRLLLWRRD